MDTNNTVLTDDQWLAGFEPLLDEFAHAVQDESFSWRVDVLKKIEAHIRQRIQPAASEAGAVPVAYVRASDLARLRSHVFTSMVKAPQDGFVAIYTAASPSAPAAQPEKQAERKNWAAIQAAVDEYLDGYELRTDEACHTPTEFERFLLTDAVAGLLADDEFMAALAAPPALSQQAAPGAESAEPVAWHVNDKALGKTFITQSARAAGIAIQDGGTARPLIYGDGKPTAATADAQTCDGCHGSGESTALSGGGPDAYDVPIMCPECGGTGATADAQGVDFLTRVFELLPMWTAEDWNELLERNPAILVMLRPLVNSTADAQGDERAAFKAWYIQRYGREPDMGYGGAIGRWEAWQASALSHQPSAPASAQAAQIADLVLGHADGMRVSSELKTNKGFGGDTEHRFEISNGDERYGVIIILTRLKSTALAAAKPEGGDHE